VSRWRTICSDTSTPSYRERRLDDTNIQPLGGGFLDGVVGEIVG
jgi:hypothetical protein